MEVERRRLRVTGTVQGVGFRPFIHRLAHHLGLTGSIGNDDLGVWCEIQGPGDFLERFQMSVISEAPALARIDEIGASTIPLVSGESGFEIVASTSAAGSATASIPPDVAPCARCTEEIAEVGNRRHGYPFTCCTECGPRYTVVSGLPYDRERTSMAQFPLCASCVAEYSTPGDRRHHAQATCCAECGPELEFIPIDGSDDDDDDGDDDDGDLIDHEDPLSKAISILSRGLILALKGVGGFQLLCRADDDAAIQNLRRRKHRDEKPFALMTSSIGQAQQIVSLDEVSIKALEGAEAPIVLAPRLAGANVASSVAPDSRLLGVMLPASPLHRLLAAASGLVLVCTSGNRSNQPIAIDDADAYVQLRGIADAMLTHNRRIVRHADDSVGQATHGRFQLLRRARGFAPRPVRLARFGRPVLGVGAELKNTVCLAEGHHAHLSAHLGDLEHHRTLSIFERAIADLISMSRIDPELVVHDLHPEYLSTKFASAQHLAPTLAVQHHHAHLAACLADNAHRGPAIGVTFDGAGWGTDGTMWGGEFLVGDAVSFERAASLAPVPMPGSGAAVREPWRMAVAHIGAAHGEALVDLPVIERHSEVVADIMRICANDQTLLTSSMGRLFDAVAAICDLSDRASYEGQAAILLEQIATETEPRYDWDIGGADGMLVADPARMIRAIAEDRRHQIPIGVIAGAFHRGVADLIVGLCLRLRERTGINCVALTGGVFQNRLLVELVMPLLDSRGFETLRHAQVPPNDGGISLGQVAVGRAHLDQQ